MRSNRWCFLREGITPTGPCDHQESSVSRTHRQPGDAISVHSPQGLHQRRRPNYHARAPKREDVYPRDEQHCYVRQRVEGQFRHQSMAQADRPCKLSSRDADKEHHSRLAEI